jgi:DNA-binding transcriptional LysR family regulator
MRYVQLRAFHHVAIYGGFSRAAEMLFLTQPAISDQVRKLEEEYDILLFNRNKKQVTLTEAGQRLLEITHRMFDTEPCAQGRCVSSPMRRTISCTFSAHFARDIQAFRFPYAQAIPRL